MHNDTKQNEGKSTQNDVNGGKMMQNDAKAKSEIYNDTKKNEGKNTKMM